MGGTLGTERVKTQKREYGAPDGICLMLEGEDYVQEGNERVAKTL